MACCGALLRRALPPPPRRLLSTRTAPPQIFDARTKALQKARAAVSPAAADFDYLRDEVATRLVDRLHDVARPFPAALDLFCGSAHVLRALRAAANPSRTQALHHCDVHAAVLRRAAAHFEPPAPAVSAPAPAPAQAFVLPHERAHIPLAPRSLDLVLSAGALHWVNDLPLLLRRVRDLLRPDGLFLAAMSGGDTLHELRIALQLAEEQMRARLAPRVSPMVRLRDAAALLSGAGLALTTADVDRIVVPYTDMSALMRHLRGMGETNALVHREVHYGRELFERASAIYEDRFGFVDDQGRNCVPATFEIVHMIGWAPAETQPLPSRRGSAQLSIADLPGAFENVVPAGKGDPT